MKSELVLESLSSRINRIVESEDELPLDKSEPEYEVQIKADDQVDVKSAMSAAKKLGIENAFGESFIVKSKTLLRNFINMLKGFEVEILSVLDANNHHVSLETIEPYKEKGRPTNKYNYQYRMAENVEEESQ